MPFSKRGCSTVRTARVVSGHRLCRQEKRERQVGAGLVRLRRGPPWGPCSAGLPSAGERHTREHVVDTDFLLIVYAFTSAYSSTTTSSSEVEGSGAGAAALSSSHSPGAGAGAARPSKLVSTILEPSAAGSCGASRRAGELWQLASQPGASNRGSTTHL